MSRYLALISLVLVLLTCTQLETVKVKPDTPFSQKELIEIDSSVLAMSLNEKIGQLLIFQPNLKEKEQFTSLLRLASNNQLGGVILEDLRLMDYISLIDSLQQFSQIPLFNASRNQVSMHNQFSDLTHLPTAATISAIENDTLKSWINSHLLNQLSSLGINLSFAPCIRNNYSSKGNFNANAFINNPQSMNRWASMMLEKIQSRRVLSVAGVFNETDFLQNDISSDSDSTFLTYQRLSQAGLSGILVDSSIFSIDTFDLLSPYFLKKYLFVNTGFNGLIVADWEKEPIRNMLYAGVDLFIVKDSFDYRFNTIRKLVTDGIFSQQDLNNRVQRVMTAKSWLGLDTIRPEIDREMAEAVMINGFDDYEIRQMYEASLTLVQNPGAMLPFRETNLKPITIVKLGNQELWNFQNAISKYSDFSVSKVKQNQKGYLEPLNFYSLNRSKVIIALDQVNLSAEKDSIFIKSINDLSQSTETVLVNFGSPLNLVPFNENIALVQLYERNEITSSMAAQLLFGALQAKGKLPMALNERLPYGHGIHKTDIIRMKYTVPEEVGIAAYQLVGIDAIAKSAIADKVTPGCQVLIAKNGKIIYSKSFGKHDFGTGKRVQTSDLYDLASVTKVAATTLGVMKLYEDKSIKLHDPLSKYIDLGSKSRLKNISIRQLLTHQSGLQPNMPISSYLMYKDTSDSECNDYFCNEKVFSYITPIADAMYMDFKWQDSIWQDVYNLRPLRWKRYRYSDVNFNLLMKVIEEQERMSLDDFIYKEFYNPLNLSNLTYSPLKRFNKRKIVPTAFEGHFRKQLIHGYVHDESAALLGGVGGNAGLFGNSEALATLFQMLLNGGEYGGKKYFEKETIELFTRSQRGSKRGLGFDLNHKTHSSCSPMASFKTYGHTGFTGTCVWVDPESDLIFIFLSNRIHPDIRNTKLFKNKIRTRMHNLVYEALDSYPGAKKARQLNEDPLVFQAKTFWRDEL